MQIYKPFVFILLFSFPYIFSQSSTPTIQAPSAPVITGPTITAPIIPSVPSLQMDTGSPNETIKTTSTSTNSNNQSPPSELSSELTVSALETLNGLFTDGTEGLDTTALGGLGNFSSLGDLSTLLNTELNTTDDATTIALLQEILLKLTELEEKIDTLDTSSKKN